MLREELADRAEVGLRGLRTSSPGSGASSCVSGVPAARAASFARMRFSGTNL
jgi:hypothetical protein